jgi:DNA-binding transcriptional LysR family regulator
MKKSDDLSLVWLKAFVAVAESGKRAAAAADIGVNPSSVSRYVQDLETWLGKALLDSSVPANLYPDGERFLSVAKEVIRLLEEARLPHPSLPAVGDPDAQT